MINEEIDSIQAPKKRMAKQVLAPVATQPQPQPTVAPQQPLQPLPKLKKELTEKQKAVLQRGRDNLKAKKEQQLKDTQAYKDQMVLLKAEQLKQHKKNVKQQVGLPPVSDEEEEEVIEYRKAPKKKKKIVYVESESEEELIYKKAKKTPPQQPPAAAPAAPRGGITFY